MGLPASSGTPRPASGNRLLAAMTRAERVLVLQAAESVARPAGATLIGPGEEIRHIYLPDAGLVSMIADLPGEQVVEIGLIGREGLVGLPALLGVRATGIRSLVQVPMQGYRIPAATLSLLASGSRNLDGLLRQYAVAMLTHVGRIAACNAAHSLEQRAVRWLLQVADRVGPNIPITQEFLATMLGARRPTMNLVLGNLREARLIRTARGQLAITDRAALEAAACPCYRLMREAHESLFPNAFR